MKYIIKQSDTKKQSSFGHWGKPLITKQNCGIITGFELGIGGYNSKEFPQTKIHDDEEALFIYSGKGAIKIGKKILLLSAGTAVYIPAHTPHCIKKIGKVPLLAVYSHSGHIKKK